METNNKLSKSGKALLFITSGLLLSDPCFGAAPAKTRAPYQKWTAEEDEILKTAVQSYIQKGHVPFWVKIAEQIPGRTDIQCWTHWTKVLDPDINKNPWTKEEDQVLTTAVQKGNRCWAAIAKQIPGKTDIQCRQRWMRVLNPTINKDEWTKAEDVQLMHFHTTLGNKWVAIAEQLGENAEGKHRTDYQCQERYNRKLKNRDQPPQAAQPPAQPAANRPPPPALTPAQYFKSAADQGQANQASADLAQRLQKQQEQELKQQLEQLQGPQPAQVPAPAQPTNPLPATNPPPTLPPPVSNSFSFNNDTWKTNDDDASFEITFRFFDDNGFDFNL
jgi:hypothetical protein